MSNERECYVCGAFYDLHKHHIYYGTWRRKVSEREGCWVYLCARHHNMSNAGVHFNKELDNRLKRECERKWLERNSATVEGFVQTFGRNYL